MCTGGRELHEIMSAGLQLHVTEDDLVDLEKLHEAEVCTDMCVDICLVFV